MPDEVLIAGGGIAVAFRRAGDRFVHAIGWLDADGGFVPALESVEGTPDDLWPPSPPLQSLHCEDRPDGQRLALLVGMSGRSHWSLSVELDPARGAIAFDAACRLHDEPGALTSTYRIVGEAVLSRAAGGLLVVGGGQLLIEAKSSEAASCSLTTIDALRFAVRSLPAPGTLPRTIRWRYSISPA